MLNITEKEERFMSFIVSVLPGGEGMAEQFASWWTGSRERKRNRDQA
jgi:hypothetical protein